jgi:hypothetical protein
MPENSDGQVKKQMIIQNYDREVEQGQCGTFTLNDSGNGLTPVKHLKMKTEYTQQYGRTLIVRYVNKPYPYIFEYN